LTSIGERTSMRWIEGGTFSMGSARFYQEERPVRLAQVESFWIDEIPVTNAAFGGFVEQTGYVTLAERPVALGQGGERSFAGSAVFAFPPSPVRVMDPALWWEFRKEACWRHPLGEGSDWTALADHPVVHVAYEDGAAYAAWAGKRLPTEAEWEFAARGGLAGAEYAWGNELAPEGLMLANYWQGDFPHDNRNLDGWRRTSPVRSFPANGYGLYDMIGNVWEWTADDWSLPGQAQAVEPGCCTASAQTSVSRKVLKGGSHLCAPNYCQRYRPAARHPQLIDCTTSHIGFRCVAP